MKTITFKELIELIEKNEQPQKMIANDLIYNWENNRYYGNLGYNLTDNLYLDELMKTKFIIPTEPLLTDQEKAYLKAVIEPFRGEVESIYKSYNELIIKGLDDYYIARLYILDSDYKGLKLYERYSLKDLDLE